MKYRDGTTIAVGDKVRPWSGCTGTVVCSIDTDDYTPQYPKHEWSYLGKGILVDSDRAGLIHYTELDEDFERMTDEGNPHGELK